MDLFQKSGAWWITWRWLIPIFSFRPCFQLPGVKGTLGRDKSALLEVIDQAIQRPGTIPLRQEWQRGYSCAIKEIKGS